MDRCFFGLAFEFDGGQDPGVAINRSGTVVEVHKREAFWKLYARTGKINQATVDWNDMGGEDRVSYTDGSEPACALNNSGVIVEVHKREVGDKLFSMYGKVNGTKIDWGKSKDYDGNGKRPSVALNDSGRVVSVFQKEDDELRYRVGKVNSTNKEIDWESPHSWGVGHRPRVAMNNSNYVIAIWSDEEGLSGFKYRVGEANAETISWGVVEELQLHGYHPAIALTDDGFVVMVFNDGVNMIQRTGRLDTATKKVIWDDALYYDDGDYPSVAAAGSMAITLHQGEALLRLWFSNSIITDRGNWMQDRLATLGPRTIRELTLPGSHDSGMYTAGLSIVAKTQELSIRGQLENGIRYFDLRPKYDAGDDRFDIHHNGVEGPTLGAVLKDIADFATGHKELIIIDFADFKDFGATTVSTVYDRFTAEISQWLGDWMFEDKPEGVRLADIPLNDYISSASSILVCINDDFALNYPKPGFWLFRNSTAGNASAGDLRVFDQYANEMDYADMRDDQLEKYETYDGICHPIEKSAAAEAVPCDLFLLSWTCTSIFGAGVWQISKEPNRHLGGIVADLDIPNPRGFIPNVLYVDYCEFARVTDVALFVNGTPVA